jgi:hypothetical protein
MNVLAGTSYEFQKYNNFELASLWDVNDHNKIDRHFAVMESYARSIKISKALGNWILWTRLRDEKFKLEQQFDDKLMRFYNDQKSGLSFCDNGIRDFEPHQVVVKKNRVLLRGLSIMLSYFAFETNSTVQGYSIGKGTSPVYPYQEGLENEVDRVVITEGGKSSSGNYLRYSTQFSDALETDTYSEFGLEMFMNGPPSLARTVIDELSRRLHHEQGNTFIIGSHYIVFVPQ